MDTRNKACLVCAGIWLMSFSIKD